MRGKKQQVKPLPRTFPKLWHPQTFLPSVPVGYGCYGDEREQGWRHAITACPPVAGQYHLSVRSSKILQKPHCFPPQGVRTRGSKSSPAPPSPYEPQTPHFPWAVSSASRCPPPTPPSQGVPDQTLLFPPPTSQLCLSLCPNISSILIKSEPCTSFCSISRLKVLQARDCVSCTSPCERRGSQPMMAKLKSLAPSLWMCSFLQAFVHAILAT